MSSTARSSYIRSSQEKCRPGREAKCVPRVEWRWRQESSRSAPAVLRIPKQKPYACNELPKQKPHACNEGHERTPPFDGAMQGNARRAIASASHTRTVQSNEIAAGKAKHEQLWHCSNKQPISGTGVQGRAHTTTRLDWDGVMSMQSSTAAAWRSLRTIVRTRRIRSKARRLSQPRGAHDATRGLAADPRRWPSRGRASSGPRRWPSPLAPLADGRCSCSLSRSHTAARGPPHAHSRGRLAQRCLHPMSPSPFPACTALHAPGSRELSVLWPLKRHKKWPLAKLAF